MQKMAHIFHLVQFYNSCLNKVSKINSIKMSSLLKDLRLTLEDLKIVAEDKGIKDYESMSEDELLSAINPSRKAKKVKKAKKR